MFWWLITSFVFGAIISLVIGAFAYWYFMKVCPKHDNIPFKPQFEDFILSPMIQELLVNDNHGSISALNILFQFLFQELKDSGGVRRYIIRKMTAEFKELLQTKTIGKVIEKITARDFSLGTGCPILTQLKLDEFKIDKQRMLIQEFALVFDLDYTDGFSISLDVDLILGRSAYVHIKVASIKGKARIKFQREPFTHWSFAFVTDPVIDFAVTSHFESRQIPQLTTIIINQLRKSVHKKHTLPNYKIRFKPFFDQLIAQKQAKNAQIPESIRNSVGRLIVKIENYDHICESLLTNYQDSSCYLTIACDNHSFQTLMQQQTKKLDWPVFEIEIKRTNLTEQTGIMFFETIFLNQNEVFIQKLVDNSLVSGVLASTPISKQIRLYDILVSINGTQINSLKQVQRIMKGSLALKFKFQRPLIRVRTKDSINTITNNTPTSTPVQEQPAKPSTNEIPAPQPPTANVTITTTHEQNDFVNIDSIDSSNSKPHQQQQLPDIAITTASSLTSSPPKENTTDSKTENTTTPSGSPPTASSPIHTSPSLNSLTQQSSPTIQLVVNTRQKIEKKLHNAFKRTTITNVPSNSNLNGGNTTNTPVAPSSPATVHHNPPSSSSTTTTTTTTEPQPPTTTQQSTTVTHLASAYSLLEYYYTAAESNPEGNPNDIDFMLITTKDYYTNEDREKRQIYYKKSKKFDSSNLNNVISFNETFEFDLNDETKYVNICVWSSMTFKSKPRNILLGYISIPISDINAECWNTMKGEAKQKCYFKPVEGKASALSRATHSHVLSQHPGFDSSLTLGAISLLFRHVMTLNNSNNSTTDNPPTTNTNPTTLNKETHELIKNTVHQVVQNIIEDNINSDEDKLKETQNSEDDKYTHKFINLQYNETVFCNYCTKKIWFKNAYKCTFCGYIIHLKCYDKAISTTICSRYLKSNDSLHQHHLGNDTVLITDEEISGSIGSGAGNNGNLSETDKLKQANTKSNTELNTIDATSVRKTVLNNIITGLSGLRHRKWNKFTQDRNNRVTSERDFEDETKERSNTGDSIKEPSDTADTSESFHDAQVDYLCDDKSMGIQLFDDLPLEDRKLKLEEAAFKYQSTIDMMKKLKEELEKDLKSKESNKQMTQNDLKQIEQIKHLEDQMKSVMFLLMQCHVGIEHCQELLNENRTEKYE